MPFLIIALIVAGACALLTIRTLVGYGDFGLFTRIIVSMVILAGWLAPMWVHWLRRQDIIPLDIFRPLSQTGYFLFGLVFILFALLLCRDIFWYLFYGLEKLSGFSFGLPSPSNIKVLGAANIATVGLTLVLSFYALYEGIKIPAVKDVEFASAKLKNKISFVQLTDLHVNRTTSKADLQILVDKTNALNPDFVVLTGDVVDDDAVHVGDFLDILAGLKSRYGLYYSIGNHEVYSGMLPILEKIRNSGIEVLYNRGIEIPELNVFIAGIPDLQGSGENTALKVDIAQALAGSQSENYRILLSHRPDAGEYLKDNAFDLQLSGHTHGGQIFPFHYLAQNANRYLAGSYQDNGTDIYVSRGAGYWGPPMRLLAPSEITHITVNAFASTKAEVSNGKELKELVNAQNLGLGL